MPEAELQRRSGGDALSALLHPGGGAGTARAMGDVTAGWGGRDSVRVLVGPLEEAGWTLDRDLRMGLFERSSMRW